MLDCTEPFRITSEDDAFALLSRALNETSLDDGPIRIEFRGWPTVAIHLPGTPINGSISPTMMQAFIDLQEGIYRSYQLLNADTDDLRGLSKSEKQQLEFRVKVTEGSSNYNADVARTLETIAQSAVAKMDSIHLLIAILGVSVIVGGVVALKSWLTARTEDRKAEVDKEETRAFLDAQKELLAHNLAQAKLLADASARVPVLADVEAAVEIARNQIIRAVSDEKGGTVQGVQISREFGSEVVTQRRQQGTPTTLSGIYKVAKVDTTVSDGFRVTLTDQADGKEITASLQDALVSEEHREVIREAEWSKRKVKVRLNARLLRSRYINAVILHAEALVEAGNSPAK